MSRAGAFCLLRASAAAAAAAFASRRIHGDASGAFSEPASASTPPDPAGLDAPVAAAYPKTAANKSTAQWRVYTDVARDLSSRGDLEAAGVYLRRALAEAIAGFGEDDPHVAAARNNLAELYRLQRRFDEAEKLYAVAAAALEKHYGPSHPAAGAATHNLAGCKLSRGDYAGAYRAYASAALKKKKALGAHHPDYAATLFHMAEAKRAGGEYAAAVTLLEESVRVLDASGQGESAVACRRMERLAQTQGDLNGDHVAAEATRRRVLEAREHAAKVAGAFSRETTETEEENEPNSKPGEKPKPKPRLGFVGAAAAAAHGGAVASAAEAHASSLAQLGRWDEAVSASKRAVELHEARFLTAAEETVRDTRREGTPFDKYFPSLDTSVDAIVAFASAATAAVTGPGKKKIETDASSAGRENLRLQLAASRLKCADVMARAARSGTSHQKSDKKAPDFFRGERAALISDALKETQRAAESAAGSLARRAVSRQENVSTSDDECTRAQDSGVDDHLKARTVAASLRRRESAEAPERHVAALVLFGRAARGALALAEDSREENMASSTSFLSSEPDAARRADVDGLVSLADATFHVGDAAEWLAAGARAAALAEMDEKHRRALQGELRECRAALAKARA
jgi:hypothetical protein